MGNDNGKDRHPFRALFKLLLFVGFVAFVASYLNGKKLEWTGLSESEARQKFTDKMGPRIGEEKAAEIADEVIPKLKERGLVVDDPIAEAVEDVVQDVAEEG